MPSRQGSVELLADPVAQRLLASTAPARLAYVWSDGTPRIVPIGFHWNGTEIVLGTFPDSPKMRALRTGTRVAVSIDTDTMPYEVLQVRGAVRTDVVDGIAPEYEAMTTKTLGAEAGRAWLGTMGHLCPRMARVFVVPDWVAVLDFQTRFPSALERAMEGAPQH